MADEQKPEKSSGYAKTPLWQWIVIYIIIGGIIYALIYYFVLAKKGGYGANYNPPANQQQNYAP